MSNLVTMGRLNPNNQPSHTAQAGPPVYIVYWAAEGMEITRFQAKDGDDAEHRFRTDYPHYQAFASQLRIKSPTGDSFPLSWPNRRRK